MATTITDIAKLVGVSHCCVSKVLSGAPIRVSESKRQKILEVAREFNYIPNQSAKSLKSGKNNSISVVAYNITDAFAVECISATERDMSDSGYRVMWTSCVPLIQNKVKSIGLLNKIAQACDGIIIIGANDYLKDVDINKFWAAARVPIVTIIRAVGGGLISSVTINEEKGSTQLIKHLVELGHKKIGFCRASHENYSADKRFKVFKSKAEQYKYETRDHWQFEVNGTVRGGYEAGMKLIKNPDRPTAVIAFNDLTAIGLLRACYEMGVKVPQDISIASFDNVRMAESTTPSLTTVAADFDQMVKFALDELLEKIENPAQKADEVHHYLTTPRLMIRESTGKAKS